MSDALLEVDRLAVELRVGSAMRTVLHDVTLEVREGEAVGLVGESGSGKSMTARAIARLLPQRAKVSGRISFAGDNVSSLRGSSLRDYRTNGVAMIFQNPRAHVNPVRRVGDFLTEAMRTNLGMKPAVAAAKAVELLDQVGISEPERRMRQYPHELSGGMLQRVMIASVLAVAPRLVLADEPTTALDVTTQSDVMALLDQLRRERNMAMIFITHDLELAGAVCDRTAVMYAGSLVEVQASPELHEHPLHPYTASLLASRPSISSTAQRLRAVPGRPLSAYEVPSGCAFADRCAYVEQRCTVEHVQLRDRDHGATRCRRVDDIAGQLADSARGDVS
jgi:oligopeptide/dipeptide ABC transporter ATP-binding protein